MSNKCQICGKPSGDRQMCRFCENLINVETIMIDWSLQIINKKVIPLTRGMVAIVDNEDYERLMQWKWYAVVCSNTCYAARTKRMPGGKFKRHTMHQEVLGKEPGYIIDHIDGNGLNNQRENLRHVTNRQNAQNRHSIESSQYPGIYWHKKMQKWVARTRIGSEYKFIGCYSDELEAFNAYQKAVKELTGEDVIGW